MIDRKMDLDMEMEREREGEFDTYIYIYKYKEMLLSADTHHQGNISVFC